MKIKLFLAKFTTILLLLVLSAQAKASETGDTAVSSGIAVTMYYACKRVLKPKNGQLGCVLWAIASGNLLMLCNVHTADRTGVVARKLSSHAVGSAIVIPMALFE